MDRKKRKIKLRYYLGLLMHPITIFPAIIGATVAALLAVLGAPHAWLYGAGGVLAGIGMLFTRTILQGDKILDQAIEEVESESRQQWLSDLNKLEEALGKDDDFRDEKLLRDLRGLLDAIFNDKTWMTQFDPTTVNKLRMALNESFNNSVEKLKTALELKDKAEIHPNAKIRNSLLKDREVLLQDVKQCVTEFENVFNELHGVQLERKGNVDNYLARLRQAVQIGKRVRKRQESLGLGDNE